MPSRRAGRAVEAPSLPLGTSDAPESRESTGASPEGSPVVPLLASKPPAPPRYLASLDALWDSAGRRNSLRIRAAASSLVDAALILAQAADSVPPSSCTRKSSCTSRSSAGLPWASAKASSPLRLGPVHWIRPNPPREPGTVGLASLTEVLKALSS